MDQAEARLNSFKIHTFQPAPLPEDSCHEKRGSDRRLEELSATHWLGRIATMRVVAPVRSNPLLVGGFRIEHEQSTSPVPALDC